GMEVQGALPAAQVQQLRAELLAGGGGPAALAAELGFEAMDSDAAASLVDRLVAEHPDEFERLKEGNDKRMGFFVGQAMKATGGKADGKVVSALLRERLA